MGINQRGIIIIDEKRISINKGVTIMREEELIDITCPCCKKSFTFWEEDQVPGFRMKDTLYCPYCNKELFSSMEVEFHVYERTK